MASTLLRPVLPIPHPLPPIATPTVPPASEGLGSNANYFLSNGCKTITDLTVTILVTQDIMSQSSSSSDLGFSFQLNCYSPKNEKNGWQQFVISSANDILRCAIETFAASDGSHLDKEIGNLIPISHATLPAGYLLQISLLSDGTNITGAKYSVNNVGVPPAPGSALNGYWCDDGDANGLGSQHVNFLGTNGHVYEFYHPAGQNWWVNDLTALSGNGVAAAPGSPLVGYSRSAGDQHVDFIGTDGHVHELYTTPNGQWVNNDLTDLSRSVIVPIPNSPLDAYADGDDGQHVNYLGADGHVHELYIPSGGQWVDNDLTNLATGAVPAMPGSPLDGYWCNDADGQHVNFIGVDGHVHELYIPSGGQWVDNDLIVDSGNGVGPAQGTALHGYAGSDGTQHVNFIGVDGHLHELFISPGGQWVNNDLTTLAQNGVAPAPTTGLDGYYGPDGDQHVNFVGVDGHLHELYIPSGGSWVDNDLTVLSGNGVGPDPASFIDGYLAEESGQHVNFIGTDGHVHEMYMHPGAQWVNNDLNDLNLVSMALHVSPQARRTRRRLLRLSSCLWDLIMQKAQLFPPGPEFLHTSLRGAYRWLTPYRLASGWLGIQLKLRTVSMASWRRVRPRFCNRVLMSNSVRQCCGRERG